MYHEVTLDPEWAISTPHDLEAERLAVALGGWISCLELEPAIKAAKHGMLLRMRRKWYPLHRRGVGDWRIRDMGRCGYQISFPSAVTAAAYVRSPGHLAARFGAIDWQVAGLLETLACEFGTFAAPPLDWEQSLPLVEEPDGFEMLWDAGIHPRKVPALADRIGSARRALPAHHYIDIAYSGLGHRELMKMLERTGDLDTLIEHLRCGAKRAADLPSEPCESEGHQQ
ncbi:hypothetical protein H7K14_11485 [Mycolicibacter longobardus]|uniref:hypothetical protein n=1 Tax=Mycolicibacter longobardus TaxID=1108812 RepID=UPI0021F34038|nr:hypothetical protein [Mycolicibacter longobardus]MCV7384460.1 hypothetical protein [Mycolicibacter longobardus]